MGKQAEMFADSSREIRKHAEGWLEGKLAKPPVAFPAVEYQMPLLAVLKVRDGFEKWSDALEQELPLADMRALTKAETVIERAIDECHRVFEQGIALERMARGGSADTGATHPFPIDLAEERRKRRGA